MFGFHFLKALKFYYLIAMMWMCGLATLAKALGVEHNLEVELFPAEHKLIGLDRCIAGEMAENEFERIYYDNWNFPYSAYRPIFKYAKEQKISLVGLNLSRKVIRQVSGSSI